MRVRLREFMLAVGAGIAIAIGGTIFLSVENTVIGALLFTVGLYTIVLNGLYLFTGKVGYLVTKEQKGSYVVTLILTWLGNLVGTVVSGVVIGATRISGISQRAAVLCETKLSDSIGSILILAVFCGILMYVAVDGYKNCKQPLILFTCVSVFILCGFEHCIANMFYFTIGGAWSAKAVYYLLVMTIGNAVGGMLIPLIKSVYAEKK